MDFEAETLTVYEGISYGFELSACISSGKPDSLGVATGDVCVSPVPEPSSLALFASGAIALLGVLEAIPAERRRLGGDRVEV